MNHYEVVLLEEDDKHYVHPSFNSMCYDVDEIAYHICVAEGLVVDVYNPLHDEMYADTLSAHGVTWSVVE